MELIIKIVCFDINSDNNEDFEEIIKKNLFALENPLRILDEFSEKKNFYKQKKFKLIQQKLNISIKQIFQKIKLFLKYMYYMI